jgi:hypothetical protein
MRATRRHAAGTETSRHLVGAAVICELLTRLGEEKGGRVMWIALMATLMMLGCVIAIVPVLYGSIRDCRSEAAKDHASTSARAPAGALEVEGNPLVDPLAMRALAVVG